MLPHTSTASLATALTVGVVAIMLSPFARAGTRPDDGQKQESAKRAVVSIEPSCPVLPAAPDAEAQQKAVPVRVRYIPGAAGAPFTRPTSLSIELAFNGRNWTDNQRSLPMSRAADGTWEATIAVLPYWHLVLFYVKDEGGRVDNNDGSYWEILGCGADGTPSAQAAELRAGTYIGDVVAPGIGRAVDYDRAIAVLEEDLERHPDRFGHMSTIWDYRARQQGRSDAAYAKLAGEIDRFVTERKDDSAAVAAATDFAWRWRARLPTTLVDKTRAALIALDPKHRLLQQIEFSTVRDEKDARRRLDLYIDYLKRFPETAYTQYALAGRFDTASRELNDTAASEAAFEDWSRFEPDSADVYGSLGSHYVRQKTKPERAVELLTRAIDLCRADPTRAPRRSRVSFRVTVGCSAPDPNRPEPGLAALEKDVATLRHYRGQALVQQGAYDRAIPDLEFAARVFPDDSKISFALAQAYERTGRKEAAYGAYLQAATVPHQTSREPAEALERLFVGGGMGTKEVLDSRIDAASAARRKKIAADYRPVPLDRAAPSFTLATLDGKRLDNASLVGRPVVLNFWATWCAPCLAEMPGLVEFQRRNPGVAVVAVAMWSEAPDVPPTVRKRKMDSLTVAISDATGLAFGVNAVPQTVILDKTGRIRFVHSGGLDDVVAVLEKELSLLK